MQMESRLDLVDDAIQNATLFLHISKFTACLSATIHSMNESI